MCWRTAASTSCRIIRRSPSRESQQLEIPPGAPLLESVTPVYFATSCDGAADGRDSPRGDCLLYAAAGVGIAAGRLSHDSNPHVLSGSQPGGCCNYCYRPADRKSVV